MLNSVGPAWCFLALLGNDLHTDYRSRRIHLQNFIVTARRLLLTS
jgi:hypothetical protein